MVRGALLSGACLALSLAAHSAGGGDLHLPLGVVVFGLLLSGLCVAAADTRRSFGGILAVMAISQVVLHLVAGASAHHGGSAIANPPGLGMVAAHVVGALVTSAVLAHGERTVWTLWSLLRVTVVTPDLPVIPTPPRTWGSRAPERVRAFRAFLKGGAEWRGPPACVS